MEYAFRVRDSAKAVFWVHASNASRFAESYKRIAIECDIPGHDDPNSNTLRIVSDWLESRFPFDWLMIVDNVDDRSAFFGAADDNSTDEPLVEHIPQTSKGTLLYTTRSRDIGIDILSGDEPIQVPSMTADEGLAMLGDKVIRASTDHDRLILLDELAHLPLAISQAAAFMVKRRKTISNYIELLQNESTRSRVLDHRTLHHGREDRSSESVTSTWWITFEVMKRDSPRAADLLAAMSYLDRELIPMVIMQEPDEDSFDFEEAIATLEAFSLITTYESSEVCDQAEIDWLYNKGPAIENPVSTFCDMHRLVQSSTRDWLDRLQYDNVCTASKALTAVWKFFPTGFLETWPLCRLLYPHAEAVIK